MKKISVFVVFLLVSVLSSSCYAAIDLQDVSKPAVLVTGGAGYVGSHTALFLAQNGYKVVIIDHCVKKKFPWAEYFEADYADVKVLSEIFTHYKIDAVFHFAAFAGVRESVENPLDYYDNNVVKTIKLLEVMLQHGVKKIIFSSSKAIFGNPQFLPITDDHPKNPECPYGRTKMMIEMILEDFHRAYGLQFVSLRYSNAAGAWSEYGLGEEHDPETHLIPLLMRAACQNLTFNLFGDDYDTHDGTCIRTYVYVLDLAYANLAALEYLNRGGASDYFCLGTDLIYSVKEMIAAVEKFYGKKINCIILPKKVGDCAIKVTSYTKARSVLLWEPRYNDLQFILKTVDDFEKNNSSIK